MLQEMLTRYFTIPPHGDQAATILLEVATHQPYPNQDKFRVSDAGKCQRTEYVGNTRTGEMMQLLDLFCGAGGAAMGYARAGFEVVGVDHHPQPHYPFAFHQADALAFLQAHGAAFEVIHASPPCQGYSRLRTIFGQAKHYPLLIPDVRAAVRRSGKPYIIENVPGSPLINPIRLDGRMFGLRVIRQRLFECPLCLLAPDVPPRPRQRMVAGLHEYDSGQYGYVSVCGNRFALAAASAAMGIDWMTRKELSQAVPPAYTEFLGRQLLTIMRKSPPVGRRPRSAEETSADGICGHIEEAP